MTNRRDRQTTDPLDWLAHFGRPGRRWLAFVAPALLLACVLPLAAQDQHALWMELPESGQRVEANGAARIASSDLKFAAIHLGHGSDEVSYGSLSVRVNAAAANLAMKTFTRQDGIVCEVDLAHHSDLKLHAGRNAVEISYKDRWNTQHYAYFLLQAPGSSLDGQLPSNSMKPYARGERYAIVIGDAKYREGGAGVSNLAYADADADSVRQALLSPRGGNVPAAHLRYLINEDATMEHVVQAIEETRAAGQAEDTLIVYINLQGAYVADRPDEKYLLPYDVDPFRLQETALSVPQMQRLLTEGSGPGHVLLLADTSHGNALAGDATAHVRADTLANLYLARAMEQAGQATIEASDLRQTSLGGGKFGDGGVFTRRLVQGIEGKADLDGDGNVTAAELLRYVQRAVSEETLDEQLPVGSVTHGGEIVLGGLLTGKGSQKGAAPAVRR